MADDDPENTKQLHVRLPGDLHERVVAFGQRTERSVNRAAVYLLRKALDAEENR